jgi:hypothetical protein
MPSLLLGELERKRRRDYVRLCDTYLYALQQVILFSSTLRQRGYRFPGLFLVHLHQLFLQYEPVSLLPMPEQTVNRPHNRLLSQGEIAFCTPQFIMLVLRDARNVSHDAIHGHLQARNPRSAIERISNRKSAIRTANEVASNARRQKLQKMRTPPHKSVSPERRRKLKARCKRHWLHLTVQQPKNTSNHSVAFTDCLHGVNPLRNTNQRCVGWAKGKVLTIPEHLRKSRLKQRGGCLGIRFPSAGRAIC